MKWETVILIIVCSFGCVLALAGAIDGVYQSGFHRGFQEGQCVATNGTILKDGSCGYLQNEYNK